MMNKIIPIGLLALTALSAHAVEQALTKNEVKVDDTIIALDMSKAGINPFSGDELTKKNKTLDNLIVEEKIAQKKLSIKRLKHDMKTIGKKPQQQIVQNNMADIERLFNEKIKQQQIKQTQQTVNTLPAVTQQIPQIQMPKPIKPGLNAIVKSGKIYFASITDYKGLTHVMRTGDTLYGDKVVVGKDKVMVGSTEYVLNKAVSTLDNPDQQAYGEAALTGGGRDAQPQNLTVMPRPI